MILNTTGSNVAFNSLVLYKPQTREKQIVDQVPYILEKS